MVASFRLFLILFLSLESHVSAFVGPPHGAFVSETRTQRFQECRSIATDATAAYLPTRLPPLASSTQEDTEHDHATRPWRQCFYRDPTHRWRPRLELSELRIGQELQNAVVVQELLEGRTGPKVFLEVGVGRCRNGRDWKIVNAMLRLKQGRKASVTVKQTARLRRKTQGFSVFVSKIRLENDQLEVCLEQDEVTQQPSLVSVSSLQVGQEVTGTVARVEPFGVLVTIEGVNRHGLLHIQKVAKLLHRYINKEAGLERAGLTRGTEVQLQVASVRKKRLFLDFADSVKQEAAAVKAKKKQGDDKRARNVSSPATTTQTNAPSAAVETTSSSFALSPEEQAAWASYAARDEASKEEADNGEYDEDRAIEDAFGLGTY